MEVPDPHIRMNQISAVSNTGAVRFMTYARTMNAALFIVFLGKLLRSTTGKIFLMVDRLRAHQTPAVQEWGVRAYLGAPLDDLLKCRLQRAPTYFPVVHGFSPILMWSRGSGSTRGRPSHMVSDDALR